MKPQSFHILLYIFFCQVQIFVGWVKTTLRQSNILYHFDPSVKDLNFIKLKDYISGCVNFSCNCQSVSLLQAYLLLELSSSSLLAGTGGKRRQPAATGPLVLSVMRLGDT